MQRIAPHRAVAGNPGFEVQWATVSVDPAGVTIAHNSRVILQRLSSLGCRTVQKYRCLVHIQIHLWHGCQWNYPSHVFRAGCWWVPTTLVLHGRDKQFLGWFLCQDSGTSGSVRRSSNTLVEPRRHSGFAPRLTLLYFIWNVSHISQVHKQTLQHSGGSLCSISKDKKCGSLLLTNCASHYRREAVWDRGSVFSRWDSGTFTTSLG